MTTINKEKDDAVYAASFFFIGVTRAAGLTLTSEGWTTRVQTGACERGFIVSGDLLTGAGMCLGVHSYAISSVSLQKEKASVSPLIATTKKKKIMDISKSVMLTNLLRKRSFVRFLM